MQNQRPTFILARSIASLVALSTLTSGALAAAWQGTVDADVNNVANWDVNPSGQNIYFGILGNDGGPAPFRATLNANLAYPIIDLLVARGGGPAIFNHTAGLAATGNNNWVDVGTDGGTGTYNLGIPNGSGTLTGLNQGSGSVTATNEARIYVGGVEFGGGGGNGTMNIHTTGTVTAFRLIVGEQGTGVVNMDSGTINLANDMTVGFRTNGANVGNGTFRMSGGTVNRTGGWTTFGRDGTSQGHFVQSGGIVNASGQTIVGLNGSTGTFTMSGGTYNANEVFFGNTNNGNATATISGGTLNVNSWFCVGRDNSNGTLTISGTADVHQGLTDTNASLEMTNFGLAGTATVNLNGGNLTINRVEHAGNATATSIFNFNGGTLKARQAAGNFMGGLDRANVRNGGAIIDTNGVNVTITQNLEHSDIGGDNAVDGGLTKNGAGILTLTGRGNFNGPANVNGGTLRADPGNAEFNGVFSSAASVTVNNGATLESGANGLFGWSGTQTKPITVNSGGILRTTGNDVDVNVGNVTLAGGTIESGGASPAWGSFTLMRTTGKILVTENSTISALNVGLDLDNSIEVASGKTLSFTGTLTDLTSEGVVSLVKAGAGTVNLSNTNTYTGATNINGGTLLVNGSNANSSLTTINSGGTLGGTGTVGSLKLDEGILAVGNSPGTLNAGNTEFAGGTFALELNGTGAGQFDQLNITGTFSLTANTDITFTLGYTPADFDTFTIVANDSTDAPILNGFTFLYQGNPVVDDVAFGDFGGKSLILDYNGGTDSNDFVVTVVPEPGAALSLMGGLGLLFGLRRRRS